MFSPLFFWLSWHFALDGMRANLYIRRYFVLKDYLLLKVNILLEYKVSFCYCLLSWVNVTDKGFVWETSIKKSIRAHGICCHQVFSSLVYNGIQVVSKSSNKIHARIWIVCFFGLHSDVLKFVVFYGSHFEWFLFKF